MKDLDRQVGIDGLSEVWKLTTSYLGNPGCGVWSTLQSLFFASLFAAEIRLDACAMVWVPKDMFSEATILTRGASY